MTASATSDIIARAVEVLKENDQGAYTIPTKGLYPFQWNWDSCLTALGLAHYDEARAWTEIETLFAHQWPDGMVPHIVFHVWSDGYFPGPEVWQTGRPTATSGITQPAVAGFAVRRLFDRARDKKLAAERARALLPKIDAWHRWFYENRDPGGEGLVAIIHPWESGRDNSIDWDDAFERVPTEGVEPYTRRDTLHADPAHRPTQQQYDRYIWLLQHFRGLGWDNARLHDASPFQVVDPGFNAILIRASTDLADLAQALGETGIASANRARAEKGLAAMERLWSEAHGQYLCLDRVTGKLIDSASVGGILPAFAAIPGARTAALAATVERLAGRAGYVVPSHDPDDPRFDAKRYWRGPVWLVVNYMISDGLADAGHNDAARRITQSSLNLIRESGFAEYYDPLTGDPLGGGRFTWTAAMVIEFLREAPLLPSPLVGEGGSAR
ncbi:amylo-alpha-1,6-glucosidase [Mesorhizobium sp. LjRoot246]|uniref:amylo-alpha-1,6-glucosidase n=1 Tax=Mesorhizobium sp. LjRoot246 TaxID=3342294 RepID=UPI003ECD8415